MLFYRGEPYYSNGRWNYNQYNSGSVYVGAAFEAPQLAVKIKDKLQIHPYNDESTIIFETADIAAYYDTILNILDTISGIAMVEYYLSFSEVDVTSGITYESSDPTIATVDAADGTVTALKAGEVTITAKSTGVSNGKGEAGVAIITGELVTDANIGILTPGVYFQAGADGDGGFFTAAAVPGSSVFKSLLPSSISFEVEQGEGDIEIDCQTMPDFVLKVRINGVGEASLSSTVEQAKRGKATVHYSVSQKTYVIIYLQGAPASPAPARLIAVTADDDPTDPTAGAYIYGISIKPAKSPEGIESIQPSAISYQKVLFEGALYIIRENRVYNAQGQRVK